MWGTAGITLAKYPNILGLNSYWAHSTQLQSLNWKSAKTLLPNTRTLKQFPKDTCCEVPPGAASSTAELNPVILAPFWQTSDCWVDIKFGPKHAEIAVYWRNTGNLTWFICGLGIKLVNLHLPYHENNLLKTWLFGLYVLCSNLNYLNNSSAEVPFLPKKCLSL